MKLNINGLEITLLVGADPELFVNNGSNIVSAYNMIPGTKEKPHGVIKGAIQVDGMAVEFNIDPADSADSFISNVKTVMQSLTAALPSGHRLDSKVTAEFGSKYIEDQPFQARDLGCEPDYSAYTKDVNPKPNVDVGFRTAAGHVHIGWTEGAAGEFHDELCMQIVKWMDIYLGLPSVLMDSDVKRRSLYGKAGAYRPKSYGVEYRVVSNFWLSDDKYMEFVYSSVIKAMTQAIKGNHVPKALEFQLQSIINDSIESEVSEFYFRVTGENLVCP